MSFFPSTSLSLGQMEFVIHALAYTFAFGPFIAAGLTLWALCGLRR